MQNVYGNMKVSVYFPKLTSQYLVPIFYIPDKLTMFSQKLKEKQEKVKHPFKSIDNQLANLEKQRAASINPTAIKMWHRHWRSTHLRLAIHLGVMPCR